MLSTSDVHRLALAQDLIMIDPLSCRRIMFLSHALGSITPSMRVGASMTPSE